MVAEENNLLYPYSGLNVTSMACVRMKDMTVLSQEQITSFQKEILDWYKKNKRDLPWRHPSVKLQNSKERDPYKILVSEVMSQQTQIARVIPKYLAWMERFPTIQDVAEAPTSEILRYWNGLGYNRRALYLQRLAKEIAFSSRKLLVESRNSKGNSLGLHSKNNPSTVFREKILWPQTEKELRQLPGIGEYTSRALLCFAFNKQIPVIDTNVRKVILVHFNDVIPDLIRDPEIDSRFRGNDRERKAIQFLAEKLLPKGKAYEWNQALMDYAGTELKAHKIPIPKQSKFKDSDRYYRGRILKLLLEKGIVEKKSIQEHFTLLDTPVSKERMQTILQGMKKDFLIQQEGNNIKLP